MVARAPYITLFISLCVIAVCGGGLPLLATELDYEASWIPQKAKAWQDRVALRDTFGSTAISEVFMVHSIPRATEQDVLQAAALQEQLAASNSTGNRARGMQAVELPDSASTLLAEALASGTPELAVAALGSGSLAPPSLLLQLAAANAARSTQGYLDRCQRAYAGGPCVEVSVGAAMGAAAGSSQAGAPGSGNAGVAGLLASADLLGRVDAAGAGGLALTPGHSVHDSSGFRTPEGVPVPVDAVVGGAQRGGGSGTGKLRGASATQLLLQLESPPTQADRDRVRDLEERWIQRVNDAVECGRKVLRRSSPQSVGSADMDLGSAAPVRPDGSSSSSSQDSARTSPAYGPDSCGGDGRESIQAEDAILGQDAARGLRRFAADWSQVAPRSYSALVDSIDVLPFASRTFQDEQDRMVAADTPLVGAAVGLMIVYVALVLGDYPPVRSRVMLAMVCVLGCVGGSLAISFGLGGYFGVPFNTMSQLAFFVLVAVGVDDGLLLSAVWDRITAHEQEELAQQQQQQQQKGGQDETQASRARGREGPQHHSESATAIASGESSRGLARSRSGIQQFPDATYPATDVNGARAPPTEHKQEEHIRQVDPADVCPKGMAEPAHRNGDSHSKSSDEADDKDRALVNRLALRLARTLREAGPSVTLTSITDALAFAIGTAIDIGAIRQFCITSAVAVVAVLVLQVTAFCAALVLDSRRRMAGRVDCCPCVHWQDEEGDANWTGSDHDDTVGADGRDRPGADGSTPGQVQPRQEQAPSSAPRDSGNNSAIDSLDKKQAAPAQGSTDQSIDKSEAVTPSAEGAQVSQDRASDGSLDHDPQAWEGERCLGAFVRHHVAPIIRSPCQRRTIILGFLALAAIAGWQASMVTKGLDEKEYLAEGSIPFRYLTMSAELFGAGADRLTIAAIGQEGGKAGSGMDDLASPDEYISDVSATDFASSYELGLSGALEAAAAVLVPGSIPPTEMPLQLTLGLGPLVRNVTLDTAAESDSGTIEQASAVLALSNRTVVLLQSARAAGSAARNSTVLAQAAFELVDSERRDLQGDVRFRRWRGADGQPLERLGPSVSAADVDQAAMARGDYVLFAWRAVVTVRPPADTPKRLDRMLDSRDAIELSQRVARQQAAAAGSPSTGGSDTDVVAFMGEFLWLERYAAIDRITIQNLLLAGGAVLVSMLMFQPPRAALLTTGVVALTCVDIIGGMTVLGLPINVATLVNLVMALGFACDYSAHVAQHFCCATGSKPDRAAESLAITGAAVANGGFSTLLATFVLAFSQSGGFQTLFKMFALMVGFGLVHGMVLLPLLLAELGPEQRPWGLHGNADEEGNGALHGGAVQGDDRGSHNGHANESDRGVTSPGQSRTRQAARSDADADGSETAADDERVPAREGRGRRNKEAVTNGRAKESSGIGDGMASAAETV